MMYRISHVCKLYDVAPETARIWAVEFAPHLSPTAAPGKNKHRLFTEEDMRVFSLISELKSQGLTYADIHMALKNGQRGAPPTLPAEEVQALVVSGQERQLRAEVDYLQQALVRAQEELKTVVALKDDLQHSKDKNIRLEARLDEMKEREGRLEQAVRELSRELGEAYGKGFVEGFEKGRGEKET